MWLTDCCIAWLYLLDCQFHLEEPDGNTGVRQQTYLSTCKKDVIWCLLLDNRVSARLEHGD